MTKKLQEVEIVRALSALAVVLIHTSANYMQLTLKKPEAFLIISSMNVFAKFAVQVFIFISGLVMFYSYKNKQYSIPQFYLKRVNTVLIPYAVWTLAYLLLYGRFMGLNPIQQIQLYLMSLVTGQASYHTYFILLIVQFYMLFPFLEKFLRKYSLSKKTILWSLLVYGLFVFMDYYVVGLGKIHVPRSYVLIRNRLFISWFVYFLLGAYVAYNLDKWQVFVKRYAKHAQKLMVVLLFAIVGEFYFSVENLHFDLGYAATPLKPSIFLYSLISIVALYSFAFKIVQKGGRSKQVLLFVSKYSLSLYFAHPIFLKLIVPWHLWAWAPYNLALSYVITVIISLLVMAFIARNKQTAFLLGAS